MLVLPLRTSSTVLRPPPPCHGHKWLKHQGRALNSSKLEEDVLREEEGIAMSPTHRWCRLSACKSEPVEINPTIFCILKWRDIRPSMVTHTRNLCSAINPSKVHTHSSEHTHTVKTHPEQWAVIYVAAPGEQLGVRCLAQGHLSRGIEGEESAVHSLPPPTIPAGPETQTRNLWITSPTL